MARDRWKRRQRDLKMGFNERQNGTVCVCNVCVCVCVCAVLTKQIQANAQASRSETQRTLSCGYTIDAICENAHRGRRHSN